MDPQKARIQARYKREQDQIKLNRRYGGLVGSTLGAIVLGIYFYSMYAVKQDTTIREIDDEIEKSTK